MQESGSTAHEKVLVNQTAPVAATPHFPYPSAQVTACGDIRIPTRQGIAFAYSCVLSRRNDGDGPSLDGRFINRLGVIGSTTGQAEYSFVARDLLQHLGNDSRIAHIIAGHANRTYLQRLSVNADMQLAPLTSALRAVFVHFHSPSPKNLMSVESKRNCSPAWLERYGT
mgnify:CR=1 FL=1